MNIIIEHVSRTGPFSIFAIVSCEKGKMEANFNSCGAVWCHFRATWKTKFGYGKSFSTFDAALDSYKGAAAKALLRACKDAADGLLKQEVK